MSHTVLSHHIKQELAGKLQLGVGVGSEVGPTPLGPARLCRKETPPLQQAEPLGGGDVTDGMPPPQHTTTHTSNLTVIPLLCDDTSVCHSSDI